MYAFECEECDLIIVQHQYNNSSHEVGLSMWDPPSCEGLLYNYCIGIVNITFSVRNWA
jgi:hypothetical protein